MKFKFYSMVFSMLLLVACSAEVVEVTREVEKEVEVTRIVELIQEVEREVEVTRIVEITQEVEVTREFQVTRVVEVEVTAVPTPTPVSTATPVPTPTNTPLPPSADTNASAQPTSAGSEEALLNAMIGTRTGMQNFGGMIDAALRSGFISCEDVVNTYDNVVFSPTFDLTNASPAAQNAYGGYRAAIEIFRAGAFDMADNCRTAVANPGTGTTIGHQQWGLARQQVNAAVDTIHPAIQSLGGE